MYRFKVYKSAIIYIGVSNSRKTKCWGFLVRCRATITLPKVITSFGVFMVVLENTVKYTNPESSIGVHLIGGIWHMDPYSHRSDPSCPVGRHLICFYTHLFWYFSYLYITAYIYLSAYYNTFEQTTALHDRSEKLTISHFDKLEFQVWKREDMLLLFFMWL